MTTYTEKLATVRALFKQAPRLEPDDIAAYLDEFKAAVRILEFAPHATESSDRYQVIKTFAEAWMHARANAVLRKYTAADIAQMEQVILSESDVLPSDFLDGLLIFISRQLSATHRALQ